MASPGNVKSIDQHYIPKFYLKGFMDKNSALWVYEKGANAPRQSTPKKEGHRENYYTFTDRGYSDNSVEAMLCNAESIIAPVIRKLANPQFKITDRQRNELYTFVALTFVRVPAYREFINDQASKMMTRLAKNHARSRDKFYAAIKDYEKETGQLLGDPEKLREFAASYNYTVFQESAGFNLRLTFQSCLSISEVLEQEYRHDILYTPSDCPFLTCDNPIVTIEPDTDGRAWVGMGFDRPKTEVLFPLNKRACMILSRRGGEHQIEATPSRVRQINDMMMGVAQKFAFASIGHRRLARIFNVCGCKIKYGGNAFMAGPHPSAQSD